MQSMVNHAHASVMASLVALGVGVPVAVAAQYETVPRPAAYALRDVTVIEADGDRREGMTVVVRGALVESIGRNVALPADARVLEGDSLMVYPGLIDGRATAEHEFPAPEIDRGEVESWNAPRELSGFMPSRRLVAYLEADGSALGEQRKAGIVAGAVHPDGAMMPGRGVLLLYRPDAETPEALVIEPVLGPTFTWQGGRGAPPWGAYPATLFGVTAFMRQAFEDARHRGLVLAAHERDPERLTTPAYDPDYAVLREVLEGDERLYFEADDAASILRVLGLAEEYGFRPVILDGGEAWKVAAELERRDIPVLVSMAFPEPRRWDPDDEAAEPLDAAALRERAELEDRYANAGRLAEAGVAIALTSGGTGKILEGARKAVEHGLDESAALAAMTTTPASLYGIPHVPRIERGLPATFIVTTGPLFSEETRVAYAFVEGVLEEGALEQAAEAGSADEVVDFGGTWDMTVDAEGQVFEAELVIEQDGATFTGTLTMAGQRMELRNGVIDGDGISAVAEMEQGGETLDVEITGTVEGDRASGEADAGPLGISRWSARRTGPGGGR